MYNHLISFIDKENILYKFQFGFRKSYSTNHAIISMVEKVNQALDWATLSSVGTFSMLPYFWNLHKDTMHVDY